jgi:hypothetical protein
LNQSPTISLCDIAIYPSYTIYNLVIECVESQRLKVEQQADTLLRESISRRNGETTQKGYTQSLEAPIESEDPETPTSNVQRSSATLIDGEYP